MSIFAYSNATNVAISDASEHSLCTLQGINLSATQLLLLLATVDFTTGAGTTSVVFSIRVGAGTGGALVRTATTNVAGASRVTFPIMASGGVGQEEAGIQYTATAQQVGATAAGTVNAANIVAISLP